MKNKLINLFRLFGKPPVKTNIFQDEAVLRLSIANEVRGLLLPSPIDLEDEGYNDGIEAAVKKILGK